MSGTLAFHYGNFDNHYGDDTRANAAKNGRIYSDTLTSEIPAEYGTFTMSGTASGQTTYSWTPVTVVDSVTFTLLSDVFTNNIGLLIYYYPIK